MDNNLRDPESIYCIGLHAVQDPVRMQHATWSYVILLIKFKVGNGHTLMSNLRKEITLSKDNIT